MLLDLLFPNRCLSCNRLISADELVCGACLEHVDFTHHTFGADNELKQKCSLLFPVQHAFALMQFGDDNLSRKIVHTLKYGGRMKVGEVLAQWTSEKMNFGENKPDLLVSVPLHPKKLRERGYNQLHLFTEKISDIYGIPYDHEVIKRNAYKKAQALKDKTHRSETDNLFSITKNISGKHVLIIDDVFTTGNTMAAMAWEILKEPSNKVSVLVMAVD